MGNEFCETIVSEDGVKLTAKQIDFFCPVCEDLALQIGDLNGTQVCGCPQCNGFLIDSLSLGTMISALRAEYRGADDQPELLNTKAMNENMSCPTCFSRMYTHPYHGPGNVVLNSCSDCQLNWLDQGELAKIIRAPGRRA